MLSALFATSLALTVNLEERRVQDHLLGAELQLLARGEHGLSAEQRQNRALNVDRLRTYRAAGQFPKNRDFPLGRVPYFRDADGTLCAMAWLLWESGEHALVEHVVATRNNATVHELADEPGLAKWLSRNGLTLEEAARIQPAYNPYTVTMATPSHEVRVGACSPAVTVEAVVTGTDERPSTRGKVGTASAVEFYSDVDCRSAIHHRITDVGREATFEVVDGGGSFHFRPLDEGTVDLQLFVGNEINPSTTSQQHHVFALDGGYRIPEVSGTLPAAPTGCSTTSRGSWLVLPLVLALGQFARRLFRRRGSAG